MWYLGLVLCSGLSPLPSRVLCLTRANLSPLSLEMARAAGLLAWHTHKRLGSLIGNTSGADLKHGALL